ncbi:hypothetical protein FACS1894202_13510 [Clostridia bacterium]|nr:hypothetical protein FACS1894202_13510 [Clostridia bacterium]
MKKPKRQHIITAVLVLAVVVTVGAFAALNRPEHTEVSTSPTVPSAELNSPAPSNQPSASFPSALINDSDSGADTGDTDEENGLDIQDGVDPYQTQPSPPPPPVPSGDITNPDAPPTYPSDEITATTTVTPIPEVTPPPKKDGDPKPGDKKTVDGVSYTWIPGFGWSQDFDATGEDSPNVPVDDPDKIVGHFG